MDERELRVGDWYVVAGEGPMKLVELPRPPFTLGYLFRTDYGHLWHAAPSQIIAVVDLDFAEIFAKTYSTKMKGKDPYRDTKRIWLEELLTWAKGRSK